MSNWFERIFETAEKRQLRLEYEERKLKLEQDERKWKYEQEERINNIAKQEKENEERIKKQNELQLKTNAYISELGNVKQSVNIAINALKSYAAAPDDKKVDQTNAFAKLETGIKSCEFMKNTYLDLLSPKGALDIGSVIAGLKSINETWEIIRQYGIEKNAVNCKTADAAVIRMISEDLSKELNRIEVLINELASNLIDPPAYS